MDALRPLLAPAFSVWGSPVRWVEIAAFVLSLAMAAWRAWRARAAGHG